MSIVVAAIIGFTLVSAGAIIVVVSIRWFKKDEVASRLTDFVAEESEADRRLQVSLSIQTRQIRGSLSSRMFLPIIRGIGNLVSSLTPAKTVDNLRKQLAIAGNPAGLGPREFYSLRLASTLLGAVLAFLILQRSTDRLFILMAFLIFVICFILPTSWLKSKVRARQDLIRRGLPDALDMLSVCASAGLGFDQSLQRVSEHWDTPIGVEFGRVISEMEMGLSRRDALRNLADRLEVTELSSFVSFVLQSDQLGMSIADTLHAQAEQMRIMRRFRAQEQAQKIPSKMLIPMVFLIFPALLAIILGPAVPRFVELFSSF